MRQTIELGELIHRETASEKLVVEPDHGLSLRGPSADKPFSGDVVRKHLVQMEQQADLNQPALIPPPEPRAPAEELLNSNPANV